MPNAKMRERSLGETYNKSYIAIPIVESPLFKWVQSINGNKAFYHITVLFLGNIDDNKLSEVREVMSSIPKHEGHLPIIPEKLTFSGNGYDAFVLRIKKTDELAEIRDILEKSLPESTCESHSFQPHITIKRAKRGQFDKFDRNMLLNIPDKSNTLDPFEATAIGLYYRTEEGATALLYSKTL